QIDADRFPAPLDHAIHDRIRVALVEHASSPTQALAGYGGEHGVREVRGHEYRRTTAAGEHVERNALHDLDPLWLAEDPVDVGVVPEDRAHLAPDLPLQRRALLWAVVREHDRQVVADVSRFGVVRADPGEH